MGTQGYSTSVSIEFVPLNIEGSALKYNPANRIASVFFTNDFNDKVSYRLISVSGQLVFESTNNDSKITLDLSGQPAMIYLLTLKIKNKSLVVKIPGF